MAEISEYTFEIYRGDDTTFVLDVRDNEDKPLDFTGCELSMLITTKQNSYMMKLGNGLALADGKLNVIFSHELTRNWEFKQGKYDLQMIDTQGKVKTILLGEVIVTRDITP